MRKSKADVDGALFTLNEPVMTLSNPLPSAFRVAIRNAKLCERAGRSSCGAICPGIGQAVPLLKTVHTQHPGHPEGLAADAPARWVQRLDDSDQPLPRHDALHLGEKLLAPRELLLHCVLSTGKAALGYGRSPLWFNAFTQARVVPARRIDQHLLKSACSYAKKQRKGQRSPLRRGHMLPAQAPN